MEPHPVPQNILDVEFKLFGSFTLKQFAKLLLGCIFALIIYFVNINALIKLPLMGASIVIGILLAIIPNFGVWLGGYLKALFISPRYVWTKEANAPEMLRQKIETKKDKTQSVSKSKSSKNELSQISLKQLFGEVPVRGSMSGSTRLTEDDYEDAPNKSQETNLDQLYSQVYSKIQQKNQERKQKQMEVMGAQTASVPYGTQLSSQAASPVENQQVSAATQSSNPVPDEPSLNTPQDYQNRINYLKQQLGSFARDQNYAEKEAAVMNEINQLFEELKRFGMSTQQETPSDGSVTNMQGKMQVPGQIVFGIIVDKNDRSVSDGEVIFTNLETNEQFKVSISAQGRFSTGEDLRQGNYEVTVEHPQLRFHRYNIRIGNQKLPAYKFRAK